LKHLLAGIQYAIGENMALDYTQAKQKRTPEENRFSKTMLAVGEFTEPTELTILPNLDILISQRRGEILLWNEAEQSLQEVAKLDVYWQSGVQGVNAEEGLMGIQKDPNYASNNLYLCTTLLPETKKSIDCPALYSKMAYGTWIPKQSFWMCPQTDISAAIREVPLPSIKMETSSFPWAIILHHSIKMILATR